ncbi:MAG: hypothetical protein COW84_07915 [Gammaproteobacteria bacterium CG22_combo_CG10-13_8_21_14_all_40_8]|nr:MAG: hypothetical protein COW84_07915 [Gammaproteobacteria bacterium CG22_combo_CG10-13_8_21_14_all_40_8]
MGLITLSGLGSSLDIDSIVKALVTAEGAAKTSSLNRQENTIQSSISGFGTLSSALSTFKTALGKVNELSDFSQRVATSSDETSVTISASSTATPANFAIDVVKTAKGTQLQSGIFGASTDTVGSGNLTLTAGTNTFNISVLGTDTLTDIQNKINTATDNFGVNVNIINSDTGTQLVFDSNITGSANSLVITNDNASLDSISTTLTTTQAADDAQIKVNNLTITNSTNVFTNAVPGTTITAVKATTVGSPVDVSVSLDTDGAKTAITDFVTAYNELAKVRNDLGASSTNSVGLLNGNSTLRSLSRQLSTTALNPVASITGSLNGLAQLGINITQQDGLLEIDNTKFDAAIANNFNDVGNIFAASDGVAVSLESIVDQYIQPLTGILVTTKSSLDEQQRAVDDGRIELSDRLAAIEVRLRKQFGAMDALIGQLKSTGDFLTQQLSSLNQSN